MTYLQELHSLGLANADHTTLLLNTYTKLKDVSRLDSFIKSAESPARHVKKGNDDDDELPFDLDTAIRVCRQAGYFEHAAYLAKRYERHEDYLRIQIEDAENFRDALTYLRKLGPAAVRVTRSPFLGVYFANDGMYRLKAILRGMVVRCWRVYRTKQLSYLLICAPAS